MNAIPPGKMAPADAGETPRPEQGAHGVAPDIALESAPDPELTRTGGGKAEGADAAAGDAGRGRIPPRLAQLDVALTVQLGTHHISLQELMETEPGQLFQLDRMTADPVDVLVNGQLFAYGEVVAVGERFGIRLTELAGPDDD